MIDGKNPKSILANVATCRNVLCRRVGSRYVRNNFSNIYIYNYIYIEREREIFIYINYLSTLFRVLQGRTGNFRELHFLKGFRDFFVNIHPEL